MNDKNSMAIRATYLSLFCILLIGCGTESSSDQENGEQYTRQAVQKDYSNLSDSESLIAKVKVLSDGGILLDEKRISVDELRSALEELRKDSGAVWFYRESTRSESSDECKAVMDILLDEGLPTRYSTKPDFSDSVPPFEY